jgi:hypothetical protein
MNKSTILASGPINGADELLIELIEPPNLPPVIRFRWPDKPSLCTSAQLDATVAAAMKVLANSVIELAAIRVLEATVSGDDVGASRGYWWTILLYLGGAVVIGVIIGLTAVAVARPAGWL